MIQMIIKIKEGVKILTIEEILKKWNDRADSLNMSYTDDPYFAKVEIRDFIKDIENWLEEQTK